MSKRVKRILRMTALLAYTGLLLSIIFSDNAHLELHAALLLPYALVCCSFQRRVRRINERNACQQRKNA